MRLAVSAMVLLFAAQCGLAQVSITKEEYGIYSLVVREFIRDMMKDVSISPTTHVLILSKTGVGEGTMPLPKQSSVDVSFANRNRIAVPIEPAFEINLKYSIVDEKELKDLVAKDEAKFNDEQERRRKANMPLIGSVCGPRWESVYERYPKFLGYIRLSRIGFSRDHRTAYVEVRMTNEVFSGTMNYVVKWTRSGWQTGPSGGGFGVC